MTRNLILTAIAERRLLQFDYQGHLRICEPHVFGHLRGSDELLTFQVRGRSSSGGLPDWRRVFVREIRSAALLAETFAGPRPFPSGRHSSWDGTYAVVR